MYVYTVKVETHLKVHFIGRGGILRIGDEGGLCGVVFYKSVMDLDNISPVIPLH